MTADPAARAEQWGAGGLEGATGPVAFYRELEGLRALAALAVVTTHVAFSTGWYGRGTTGALLARLDVGVPVFFALSGFLLARPWLAAAAAGGRAPRTGAYLWRRALRILPAYWAAVVLALVLLPGSPVGAGVWWQHLTLTQIYVGDWRREGLTQMWSLSTEVAWYLLLPVLGAVVVRAAARGGWRPGRLLAGTAGLVVAGVLGTVAAHGWLPDLAGFWLTSHVGWFAGGLALAVLSVDAERAGAQPHRLVRPALSVATQPWSCWLLALAVLVVTTTPLAGPLGPVETTAAEAVFRELAYLVVATLLLLPVALRPDATTAGAALLRSPPLRVLGRLSYGVFLYHLVVLSLVRDALGLPEFGGSLLQLLTATVLVTLGVAALSWRFLEQPALRLRGRGPGAPAGAPARTP